MVSLTDDPRGVIYNCNVFIIQVQHNDTQHNDIQHSDIQHNDIQHNDIQHNNSKCCPLHNASVVMLSVVMLHVANNPIMLNVIMQSLCQVPFTRMALRHKNVCQTQIAVFLEPRRAKFTVKNGLSNRVCKRTLNCIFP